MAKKALESIMNVLLFFITWGVLTYLVTAKLRRKISETHGWGSTSASKAKENIKMIAGLMAASLLIVFFVINMPVLPLSLKATFVCSVVIAFISNLFFGETEK